MRGRRSSPFNAWVILKGLETLKLRMQAHSANALELARWLEPHPNVERVYYPGLPSHPQHELAIRQQASGGGIVSFVVKGGREAAWRVVDATQLISITANLGDAKTTITHPASTTHGRLSPAAREEAGIGEGLLRVAVGLEALDDIRAGSRARAGCVKRACSGSPSIVRCELPQLWFHRRSQKHLRIRRRLAFARCALLDSLARHLERPGEGVRLAQSLIEIRFAEVSEVGFRAASERGVVRIGCRHHQTCVALQSLDESARVAGGHHDDAPADTAASSIWRNVSGSRSRKRSGQKLRAKR